MTILRCTDLQSPPKILVVQIRRQSGGKTMNHFVSLSSCRCRTVQMRNSMRMLISFQNSSQTIESGELANRLQIHSQDDA